MMGLTMTAALLGYSHFRYPAKGERPAGEMMTLYMCEQTNGNLEVKPVEVSVPQDQISNVMMHIRKFVQFDLLTVKLTLQRERLVFNAFQEE